MGNGRFRQRNLVGRHEVGDEVADVGGVERLQQAVGHEGVGGDFGRFDFVAIEG